MRRLVRHSSSLAESYAPLWSGLATAPKPKRRLPRSVEMTPAESRITMQNLKLLLPQSVLPTFEESSLDFQGFEPKTSLQSELMRRLEIHERRHASITELDILEEQLSSLTNDYEIWTWTCNRIFADNAKICSSKNYPIILSKVFDRLPPHLALALFHVVSTISPASFVSGCTSDLYTKMMRLKWQEWQDIEGIEASLKQMMNAGIEINWSLSTLIQEMQQAISADNMKAEKEVTTQFEAKSQDITLIPAERLKAMIDLRKRFAPAERQAMKRITLLYAADMHQDQGISRFRPKAKSMDPEQDAYKDFFSSRRSRHLSPERNRYYR